MSSFDVECCIMSYASPTLQLCQCSLWTRNSPGKNEKVRWFSFLTLFPAPLSDYKAEADPGSVLGGVTEPGLGEQRCCQSDGEWRRLFVELGLRAEVSSCCHRQQKSSGLTLNLIFPVLGLHAADCIIIMLWVNKNSPHLS